MNDRKLLEKNQGMASLARAHRSREGGPIQISYLENLAILHLFEGRARQLEEKIAAARHRQIRRSHVKTQ